MENGSYKRVADKDMKLSATEIFALQNALVPSPADKEIVPEASVDDLNKEAKSEIIRNEKINHPKRCVSQDPASPDGSPEHNRSERQGQTWRPPCCGQLPAAVLPQAGRRVMVHPDIEKSARRVPGT